MSAIPVAPGPEYAFRPPPNWPAPAGFDPRRGFVVDPSWPAPPEGWSFWVRAPVPVATRARSISKGTIVRVAIGLVVLGVVVSRLFGVGADSGTHAGSCWRLDSGSAYTPVDCGDSAAQYRVTTEVASPSDCPAGSDSYLDSKNEGAPDRYRCLVPVTH